MTALSSSTVAAPLPPVCETGWWAVRAKDADRLASRYAEGGLSSAERRSAEHALRVLRYDGETWVRRIVADAVKEVPFLPAEIAFLFATDRDEVAGPLIEASPALREQDLLALVRDFPGAHRVAVARRARVTPRVADAICRSGEAAAVRALLANPGAEIPEASLRHVLDRRGEVPGVAAALARRLLERAEGDGEEERRERVRQEDRSGTAFQQLLRAVRTAGRTVERVYSA